MNLSDIDERLKLILSKFKDGWPATIYCGPGWNDILFSLDKKLSEIDPDYKIIQIKEKFGILRYYFQTKTDKRDSMNCIVLEHESMSAVTCEISGLPGVLMKNSFWYKTLNPDVAPDGYSPV
jgi:hypothetical protein